MNNEEEDQLDLLLREHFADALDGQLGKAPAAFAELRSRQNWRIAGIGASLAAAAAIAVVVSYFPITDRTAPSIPSDPSAKVAIAPVEYRTAWQSTDSGTVYLDADSPMRSIHRTQVEVVEWTDPSTHATIQIAIPREETVLVSLNSY